MSEEKIVIAVLIARPIGAPISALHKILFFMITSIPVYEKYIFHTHHHFYNPNTCLIFLT